MAWDSWTYQPNSDYGAVGGSQVSTPIVSGPNGYLANNEDAAYYRFIAPFASGQDSRSQFIRNKMSEVLRNFRAAQATNPNLQLPSYLENMDMNTFQNQYLQTAPWLRGETPAAQLGAGRVKWYTGSR